MFLTICIFNNFLMTIWRTPLQAFLIILSYSYLKLAHPSVQVSVCRQYPVAADSTFSLALLHENMATQEKERNMCRLCFKDQLEKNIIFERNFILNHEFNPYQT